MSNPWDDEDGFRDMPVERDEKGNWIETEEGGPPLNQTPRPRSTGRPPVQQNPRQPQRPAAPAPAPELEYDEEAINSTEEDDFTEVLSDASLRLEQGNLYKLIMNNDLFAGAEADPRAVKNVEREIKRFARQRMEVMLGMRQERVEQPAQNYTVASPFNGLEVQILKQVAAAASKGATESPEAEEIAIKLERKTTLNPITVPKAKIQAPTPTAPVRQQAPAQQAPRPPQKPLASRPAAPIQRNGKKLDILDLEASRGLSDQVAEQLVDHVMDGDNSVDATQMTEKEKLAHNKKASQRRKPRVANPRAMPMPSIEQANIIQETKAANADPKLTNAVSTIMALMRNKK